MFLAANYCEVTGPSISVEAMTPELLQSFLKRIHDIPVCICVPGIGARYDGVKLRLILYLVRGDLLLPRTMPAQVLEKR